MEEDIDKFESIRLSILSNHGLWNFDFMCSNDISAFYECNSYLLPSVFWFHRHTFVVHFCQCKLHLEKVII